MISSTSSSKSATESLNFFVVLLAFPFGGVVVRYLNDEENVFLLDLSDVDGVVVVYLCFQFG